MSMTRRFEAAITGAYGPRDTGSTLVASNSTGKGVASRKFEESVQFRRS